jgi:hypothetical protein
MTVVYKSGLKQWPVGVYNEKPFSVDGDRGVNIWADMPVLGGMIAAKLQRCSPGGFWLDVTGADSTPLGVVNATLLQVYPGLTTAAGKAVNAVLGGGTYRLVVTVTTGTATAQIQVETIK